MVSYNNHVTIHSTSQKSSELYIHKQIHYHWVRGHIEEIRCTLHLWLRIMRERHQHCTDIFVFVSDGIKDIWVWLAFHVVWAKGDICVGIRFSFQWSIVDSPSGPLPKPSWLEYWLLSGLRTLNILSLIDHLRGILSIPNVFTMVQVWIGIPRPTMNHTDGTLLNQ